MGSGDIIPRVADLDRVYGRVSLRALYGGVMREFPLGYLGKPPADAAPQPVVVGPRRPLAGPSQAVALEVDHG